MRCKTLIMLAITALAGFPFEAQASILGTADSFVVLGGSTVTNTGPTVIGTLLGFTENVGVSPGSAIVGFPPGILNAPGAFHAGDAVAAQAQSDVTTAYNGLANMPFDINLSGQDLGGLTITSGVYRFNSSAQLTGTLTLDAQGNNNAFWVFQIGSTLTTASASSVQYDQCRLERRFRQRPVLAGRQLGDSRDNHGLRGQHPGAREHHPQYRRDHSQWPGPGADGGGDDGHQHDHHRIPIPQRRPGPQWRPDVQRPRWHGRRSRPHRSLGGGQFNGASVSPTVPEPATLLVFLIVLWCSMKWSSGCERLAN